MAKTPVDSEVVFWKKKLVKIEKETQKSSKYYHYLLHTWIQCSQQHTHKRPFRHTESRVDREECMLLQQSTQSWTNSSVDKIRRRQHMGSECYSKAGNDCLDCFCHFINHHFLPNRSHVLYVAFHVTLSWCVESKAANEAKRKMRVTKNGRLKENVFLHITYVFVWCFNKIWMKPETRETFFKSWDFA